MRFAAPRKNDPTPHVRNRKEIHEAFHGYSWWHKIEMFLERNRPIKVAPWVFEFTFLVALYLPA